MKHLLILITFFILLDVSAQNYTYLSVLFEIDTVNVTNKIDNVTIITNDSILKKVTIVKSQSNLFDISCIPYYKNTFLFIEFKKRLYYVSDTKLFKIIYLNNPQKDTLFIDIQYFKSPTKNILWDCRKSNDKIKGYIEINYRNEHINYSYPIFNHKKYFRKNKKFLKYTLKGRDFEFKMKQCR